MFQQIKKSLIDADSSLVILLSKNKFLLRSLHGGKKLKMGEETLYAMLPWWKTCKFVRPRDH